MNASDWLQLVILAGIAGMVGQSARVIIGMKKLNDEASATSQKLGDMVDTSRLLISLLIGFTAGVASALALQSGTTPADIGHIEAKSLLAFAAAGYAGTDFIEAFMTRNLPSTATAPSSDGYKG
jgi:hypothetical protein